MSVWSSIGRDDMFAAVLGQRYERKTEKKLVGRPSLLPKAEIYEVKRKAYACNVGGTGLSDAQTGYIASKTSTVESTSRAATVVR